MKNKLSPRDRAFKWLTELELMQIDGYSADEIFQRFDEMLGELLDEGDTEVTLRTVNTLNDMDVMHRINTVSNYKRFEEIAMPMFTALRNDSQRMDRASLYKKYSWMVRYAHEEIG